MDNYFNEIAAATSLTHSEARALETQGFVVIAGPIPQSEMAQLASAYDRAILQAASADIAEGGTTTRVHDFVNRGAEFDHLYLHAPALEAACRIVRQPFKLSSLLARTLNAHKPPQKLHVDFPADQDGWPMAGFIFMIDEFRPDNGATCFLPGSQGTKSMPEITNGLVQACGPAGSMIVYNGSVWHGHGANITGSPRRSIQGAYIRRSERSNIDMAARMLPETLKRISPLAKYMLAI